jgi:hypothetical protein
MCNGMIYHATTENIPLQKICYYRKLLAQLVKMILPQHT